MLVRILNRTPGSIRFEVTAQRWRRGQFTMPAEVRQWLGIDAEENVRVMISCNGRMWEGVVSLKSGHEVYHSDLTSVIPRGALVMVAASLP